MSLIPQVNSMRNLWKYYFLPGICLLLLVGNACSIGKQTQAWIRINQLGYTPEGIKVAVWTAKEDLKIETFSLRDAKTDTVVFEGEAGTAYGAYGPFSQTYRLDFSTFTHSGRYYLEVNGTRSSEFPIDADVYQGSAAFVLRYMRQQRSGYNPYLQDSCHTLDGYTVYGPMPDSTQIDVSGGWHDASDYLQYATTSANATYHLLAAYRDFGHVFPDQYDADGNQGGNQVADVLDEAAWGLKWLLKMHPRADWMFNQIADDRDHTGGMRLPAEDTVDYGMGTARPVYFASGAPQGLGKYKNRATGTASVAGKFASAFALAAQVYQAKYPRKAQGYTEKALSAYAYGLKKPGVTQTAPNLAPYFYEEDNWVDDMELAAASLWNLTGQDTYKKQALTYAQQEKVTPWMGTDTMRHYQWYPFHNFGHYALNQKVQVPETVAFYKEGIERVWEKAKENAFYRGIPFIWCSNNLTASFAIQCILYRKMSGDTQYDALEQANIDWLFGCNPWGTSMVYGLPEHGDTPTHPHSALSSVHHYPLDGGLVDGPVYTSIYSGLIGISLQRPDGYQAFQSDLAVYHDDYGDYSTNEPTMDGTASLVYLMAALEDASSASPASTVYQGAIIRGDTTRKKLALIFSADSFNDGRQYVRDVLSAEGVKAGFFLTGNFLDNPDNKAFIEHIRDEGHYISGHSDKHLLFCDWTNRDSLLVSKATFQTDLNKNLEKLGSFGIQTGELKYFLPPYEWYNQTVSDWYAENRKQLINFTPGTRVTADYTWPSMGRKYVDSGTIWESIMDYEQTGQSGLNGFILLVHLGTEPTRKDKFYNKLPALIKTLRGQGYTFTRVDSLLNGY